MRSLHSSLFSGQSLVEALVAIALMAIVIPALFAGISASRTGKVTQKQNFQAVLLLREAEEALRTVRESNWNTFAVNGVFHPVASGSSWILSPGSEVLNGYTRQIVISDTYRATSSGAIVFSSASGTLDQATKRADISVAWTSPYASSVSSTHYYTRYLGSTTWIQTSVADFTSGTRAGTAITNASGGEVVLGQGNANWCTPQNSILTQFTLPRSGNAIAAAPGGTIGASASAYVGMGNGTNGMTYQTLAVSAPPAPASPTVNPVGSGYTSSVKTNAVYNDGTYTYLATDGSSSQVVILNNSYTKIASITLPSGSNANGIFVSAKVLYVTSGHSLYTYNVTNPATPVTLGSATVWDNNATATNVVVQSGKAYVTMSGSITGLELFTISGGGALIVPWSVASVNWFQTPKGLAVNSTGTRAYIAFSSNSFVQGGFYIVDTSTRWFGFYNPNLAVYDTNWDGNGSTNPLGMAVVTANKALIVGAGGSQQYQVVDITNDHPTHCGGLSIAQGVSGVTGVIQPDGRVFSYIISGESNNQFKVIEGGSGGLYTTQGSFESSNLSNQFSTSYYRFLATVNQPPQTTIQMQVAAAPMTNGSCTNATYSYVGPDLTSSTFFTTVGASISGVIPFGAIPPNYQNPNQCFRYKAFLTTNDTSQSPTLYDVTVTYAP